MIPPATPLQEMIAWGGRYGTLPDREYVIAFLRDLTDHAVPLVEAARKTSEHATEDALTNMLLLPLYAAYPGASRETDNHGHVDIALKKPFSAKIVLSGEAKVIDDRGFDWYAKGLTKLVAKYNSGRNDIGLMVAYCRRPLMYDVLEVFRSRIGTEFLAYFDQNLALPSIGFPPETTGVFATSHRSAGRPISIVHVWLNLHTETDASALKAAGQAAKKRKERNK